MHSAGPPAHPRPGGVNAAPFWPDLDRYRQCPAQWLMVTGTNGKSTAVRMLESILLAAGLPAIFAGMFLWRRLQSAGLAMLRTSGTAVAVAGARETVH